MYYSTLYPSAVSLLTRFFSDTQNLRFVYEWRQEQEHTLCAAKGTGMTEGQVNNFVDGCSSPLPTYSHSTGTNF